MSFITLNNTICENLLSFEKGKRITFLNFGKSFVPRVENAPSIWMRLIEKVYKPTEARYSYVSQHLFTFFENNLEYFKKNKHIVQHFRLFFSKTQTNLTKFGNLIQHIETHSESTPNIDEMATALTFRESAQKEGDYEIICHDGIAKAHACKLRSIKWFERLLAWSEEKKEKKVDFSKGDSKHSLKVVNAFLDLLYLAKIRENLSHEEEWELHVFLDYIGYKKKDFKNLISKMPTDFLLFKALESFPAIETLLIEELLDRLRWWKKDGSDEQNRILEKLEKMAEQCSNEPHWATLQALLLLKGFSQNKDDEKAATILKELKDYPPAIGLLGYCFEFGRGIECNNQEAIQLYRKASCLGDAPSLFNLSLVNEINTHEPLLESAKKKFVPAMIQLAHLNKIEGPNRSAILNFAHNQGWSQD